MKLQEHDSINMHRPCLPVFCRVIGFLVLVASMACKNDIDRINAISSESQMPDQSGKNIEVQYSDSCKVQVVFKAPLMERYLHKEKEAFYEFPVGIEVQFYDKKEQLESTVTAKYAKYLEEQKLWVARDSVVAQNVQSNEILTTEELFWNQEEKRIYSHVFTKIINPDGIYYGEQGFESDQDFKNYKLIGSSGTVRVKDEE